MQMEGRKEGKMIKFCSQPAARKRGEKGNRKGKREREQGKVWESAERSGKGRGGKGRKEGKGGEPLCICL